MPLPLNPPANKTRPADQSAGGAGPLSPEHFLALEEARARSKKVRRAAGVATFSGWTMAIFAFVTLLGALFGDLVSLVLGIGLGVVTINELRGAAMLRRFDVAGPRLLGYNQIGLGVLIVVYAAYSLVGAIRHPMLASVGSTGDAQMDATIGNISSMAAYVMYGGVGLVGIIAPGLTALYYFSRKKVVEQMVAGTPAWVITAMRAAG